MDMAVDGVVAGELPAAGVPAAAAGLIHAPVAAAVLPKAADGSSMMAQQCGPAAAGSPGRACAVGYTGASSSCSIPTASRFRAVVDLFGDEVVGLGRADEDSAGTSPAGSPMAAARSSGACNAASGAAAAAPRSGSSGWSRGSAATSESDGPRLPEKLQHMFEAVRQEMLQDM